MAKARKTPEQIVDKQIRAAQNAVPDYVAGIQAVQQSPNQIAAQKADKYLMSIQESVSSGKYQAAQSAVSLDDWKRPALEKGQQRYAQGVAAARPKMLTFQRTYGPIRDGIADQVRAMPDNTEADRDARMLEMARQQRQNPYKRRR